MDVRAGRPIDVERIDGWLQSLDEKTTDCVVAALEVLAQ